MKIFDWVHRKFRQNNVEAPPKPRNGGDDDRSSLASVMDSVPHDQLSPVKTRRREGTSIFKILEGNVKPCEGFLGKQRKVEHYFCNVEDFCDGSVEALLVQDIQHGLLAIGTLGISNLQSTIEKIDVSETKTKPASPLVDHVPIDVEEFRKELVKVLYNRSSDEQGGGKMEVESNKEGKEREADKSYEDKPEMKINSEKKVFPLRNFLEVPQTPSEGAVANIKKKQKKSRFKNLFKGEKTMNGHEKHVRDNQSPMESCPKILDQKRSPTSVLRRVIFKSGQDAHVDTTEPVLHRRGARNFLQAFRKKGSSASTSVQNYNNSSPAHKVNTSNNVPLRDDTAHKRSSGLRTSYSPPEKNVGCNAGNEGVCNHNHVELEHEFDAFKFEEWSNEFSSQLCWFCEDASHPNAENGYWIKTDEDYVVLEL